MHLQTPYNPEGSGWWDWAKKVFYNAGYARGDIDESFSAPYWLLTFPQDRTPGKYGLPGEITEEYVHPSVHYRKKANEMWKEPIYEPAGMRGWVREKRTETGSNGKEKTGFMWIKYKDNNLKKGVENSLWEFEIAQYMDPGMSLEKKLIEGSWVEDLKQAFMTLFKVHATTEKESTVMDSLVADSPAKNGEL
jgi:hypothetical protein